MFSDSLRKIYEPDDKHMTHTHKHKYMYTSWLLIASVLNIRRTYAMTDSFVCMYSSAFMCMRLSKHSINVEESQADCLWM